MQGKVMDNETQSLASEKLEHLKHKMTEYVKIVDSEIMYKNIFEKTQRQKFAECKLALTHYAMFEGLASNDFDEIIKVAKIYFGL